MFVLCIRHLGCQSRNFSLIKVRPDPVGHTRRGFVSKPASSDASVPKLTEIRQNGMMFAGFVCEPGQTVRGHGVEELATPNNEDVPLFLVLSFSFHIYIAILFMLFDSFDLVIQMVCCVKLC